MHARRAAALVFGFGLSVAAVGVLVQSGTADPSGAAGPPRATSAGPPAIPSRAATVAAADQAAGETQQAVLDRKHRADALTQALQDFDRGAFTFAVAVVDRDTGETYTYQAQDRFETASIVKVDILAALLLQAQQSGRTLTATERALAEQMIENSDNDAASTLWDDIDDGTGLAAANRQLGLIATAPGTDGSWGLTTTTVEDQARLLDRLVDPAGPLGGASQAHLDGGRYLGGGSDRRAHPTVPRLVRWARRHCGRPLPESGACSPCCRSPATRRTCPASS